jgi:uncharacterized protein
MIVDAHCHVYPPLLAKKFTPFLGDVKDKIRPWLRPWFRQLHSWQTQTRSLPPKYYPLADTCMGLMSVGTMLWENSPEDLLKAQRDNAIDYSLVIAHPPFIPNDFVLQLSSHHKSIIPVVNLPFPTYETELLLDKYRTLGARAIKLHLASDGADLQHPHYSRILDYANGHQLPVIIHTGCIHLWPLYKAPHLGHAEHFEAWIQKYSNIKFVLAHMNYHFPDKLIELMQNYSNVYTDTSWQPSDAILKAINILGDDRIMFGTDWPILGDNLSCGIERLQLLRKQNQISENTYQKIMGLNAKKLFALD